MFNQRSRLDLVLACILFLSALAYAAQTKIDMANDIFGIGQIANGFTGSATTSAGYVLAGPQTGTSAYGFHEAKTYQLFWPLPTNFKDVSCIDTGSSASGLSATCANYSALADVEATSTTPSYWRQISDSTGAGCSSILTDSTQFYVARDLTAVWYAKYVTTTGWMSVGFATGAASFCNNDDPNTANHIRMVFSKNVDTKWSLYTAASGGGGASQKHAASSAAPDTNWHWFKLRYDSSAARVYLYIDDMATPIVTNDSYIPSTSTMYFGFWEYCKGGASAPCSGVAQEVNVSRFDITNTPY